MGPEANRQRKHGHGHSPIFKQFRGHKASRTAASFHRARCFNWRLGALSLFFLFFDGSSLVSVIQHTRPPKLHTRFIHRKRPAVTLPCHHISPLAPERPATTCHFEWRRDARCHPARRLLSMIRRRKRRRAARAEVDRPKRLQRTPTRSAVFSPLRLRRRRAEFRSSPHLRAVRARDVSGSKAGPLQRLQPPRGVRRQRPARKTDKKEKKEGGER